MQVHRPDTSARWITGIVALFALSLAGCHRPVLSVCDAFRLPGEKSMLEARFTECSMRRTTMANMPQTAVAGMNVRFYYHDDLLGEARTDESGAARLACELPDDATHFRAEAIGPRGEKLSMEALIFGFPRGRTLLVCDIDETVSMTHYRDLFFSEDDLASQPIDEAAAVLRDLSSRFGLVYLTARPGFLLEKTKRWLNRHGFPAAPVITTSSLTENLRLDRYKSGRIEYLMGVLGDVGIGIGNARSDSEAYAMRSLLPVLIENCDTGRFRAHAVVVRDWKAVRRVFEANRDVLEDPAKLRLAVANEELIARPIIRYQPPR